jgi:hypothetical protein
METWARAIGTIAIAAAIACGNEQPPAGGGTAGEAEPPPPQPESTAEEEVDPGDAIAVEMQTRAQQFAEGMSPATPLFRGTLATGATQDYQAVLQGGRCFKVVGVGGPGVTDLDLFLFDPNGVQVLQDTASDSYPVLGLTHPICPDTAGAYRVQVKMFAGTGEFGVRVYQTGS